VPGMLVMAAVSPIDLVVMVELVHIRIIPPRGISIPRKTVPDKRFGLARFWAQ